MSVKVKKVSGSALQFALLVATVVILMLFAFILLTNTHRFFRTQSEFLSNSIKQADTGIAAALEANSEELISNDSLEIRKEYLGAFKMVTATGIKKEKRFAKKALIGNLEQGNNALYLTDNIQPLVFVGESKIIGNVSLPQLGYKEGIISGNYFSGTTMIAGSIKNSSSELPKLDNEFETHISNLLSDNPSSASSSSIETQKQSFFNEKKMIVQSNPIDVFEILTGNIVLKSTSEVVIHPESKLTDVTIIAPIIRVKRNVKGRMHLIASDSIIIERGAQLSYPSSVTIYNNTISEEEVAPSIVLKDESVVSGLIIYINKSNDEKQTVHAGISIDKNARVQGQVYCKGYIELKGTIEGSVYTDYFLSKSSGSQYLNHLYDGQIRANPQSITNAGLPLLTTKNTIVQWLY